MTKLFALTHVPKVLFLRLVLYSLLLTVGITFHQFIRHRDTSRSQPTQYHNCATSRIPYVSQPLETAQYLLHTNKSLIRFGDSEVLIIRGGSEPFQRYDKELSQSLESAFLDPDENILIGLYEIFSGFPLWKKGSTNWWFRTQAQYCSWVTQHCDYSRQYFSAMITSTYVHTYGTGCALLPRLFRTLREIWKDRDIVILRGNNNQIFKHDVYDTARSQSIHYAPRYHAWSEYRTIRAEMFAEDPSKLFILTCGPVARVLAYDLAKNGRRALDLGHLAKDYDYYIRGVEPDNNVFFERTEVGA